MNMVPVFVDYSETSRMQGTRLYTTGKSIIFRQNMPQIVASLGSQYSTSSVGERTKIRKTRDKSHGCNYSIHKQIENYGKNTATAPYCMHHLINEQNPCFSK